MKNNLGRQLAILFVLVSLVFGQVGCKKYLDRKPLGQGSVGDVEQGGVDAQIFGLYSLLRGWGMTQLPFITAHASRADDDDISTPGDGDAVFIDQYQYTKVYWIMDPLWDDHMGFVSRATNVIFDIDSIDAITPDPTNTIGKAEARFLRAYAYFDLVRDYGGVPKIDFKVYVAAQANVPRASAAEIYDFIKSDLDFAIANLPEQWDAKFTGRVTKGAAYGLLSKVNLYLKEYSAALANAEAVINSNRYSLLPNFANVFTETAENGPEIIFAVQNFESANGAIGKNGEYSSWSAGYQGVRGSGQWDLGWGWNIPSAELVANGFETGDPRKGQTILFSGAKDDSLINDGKFGDRLPPSIWPYFNKKVYTQPSRRVATGDRFGSWLDMILLRYSDVLLIAAEAANELGGNSAKALGYLEQVRLRARNGSTTVLPAIVTTDQDQIRTAIKKERRAELAMEFERFYDLVRWTPATDNIDAPHVLGPLGYTDKNALLPIPQTAMDKSQGVLEQNPGY